MHAGPVWGEPELRLCGTKIRKAIDCEDHGHKSKQTMTVTFAVYLPLHVVSILCHAMPCHAMYANS